MADVYTLLRMCVYTALGSFLVYRNDKLEHFEMESVLACQMD
jgi:hypothetical protein